MAYCESHSGLPHVATWHYPFTHASWLRGQQGQAPSALSTAGERRVEGPGRHGHRARGSLALTQAPVPCSGTGRLHSVLGRQHNQAWGKTVPPHIPSTPLPPAHSSLASGPEEF